MSKATMTTTKARTGFWKRLLVDRRGAGFAEYIVLVGVVVLGAIALWGNFKGKVGEATGKQGDKLNQIATGQ
jgi:Flp pilus assembly pilin Flp